MDGGVEAARSVPSPLKRLAGLQAALPDVPEELFNGLREHFNPPQMVELTTAIAWENFRARFTRGFGVEAQGFTEGPACPVHVGAAPGPGGGGWGRRRAGVRGPLDVPRASG